MAKVLGDPLQQLLQTAYNESFVGGQIDFSVLARKISALAEQIAPQNPAESQKWNEDLSYLTRLHISSDDDHCHISSYREFKKHLHDPIDARTKEYVSCYR